LNINIQNHQHFSFDLWLTLIQSNPEFKAKRNLLFKDFFELNSSIEKITEVVRYYDVLCNAMNEKTGANISTFEIYYLILKALNTDIETVSIEKLTQFYYEAEVLFLKFKPNLIDSKIHVLFKEIVERDKTINILSNTGFINGITIRKVLQYYDLEPYFLFQIYSDEVGCSKPNKKIFQMVYDRIENHESLEKKKILHVGDNELADYNGALSFGFDALLIKI
jgi:putative hydrolase of the HAD superfamily